MGKVKQIKNSIVALLTDLQYGDETAYGQVVSDTRVTFETYPAARVIMNGQPNEISTNKQNERTPEFLIISYFKYEQVAEGETAYEAEAAAFDLAYDFNDLVIDALDNLQPKDESNNPFTVITKPAQAGWEILETDAGNVLSIMATVGIRYSHDVEGLGE